MSDPQTARNWAEQLAAGRISVDQFLRHLSADLTADVGLAQVDLDRARRCGFPEVVFGQGKTLEALERIFAAQQAAGIEVLATRVEASFAPTLAARFPHLRYNPLARILRIPAPQPQPPPVWRGRVAVITAGTSDLPVAEEARETADWMGHQVTLIQDVGVAGPHRLLAHLDQIRAQDVLIVVAGMEAALPSVVGGHVDCPVVAVPTSVGYGASFGGLAALLGMLNSCASNVTVVNIDAGFKGGYVAGLIARARNRAAT